ncbi:MAG TPA: hypothetical protein VGG59_15200 [Acidobacteriaceae bacterium]|jgi:hypothetical protein
MAESGRSTFENFGRKVDAQFGNIGPRIEDEVKRVIGYLNDQVVPQVRQNSSSALRAAAEQLARLADALDQRTTTGAQQGGERPSAS